jgi:predicted GNAT family acetyltransferase
MPAVTIDDVPARSRYEGSIDGDVVGWIDYRRDERTGALLLTHAEVDPALGGQGVGTSMVLASLDDLSARGERIVPLCSFVASVVRANPAYERLLD